MSRNFKFTLSEQEVRDLLDVMDVALKKDGLLVLTKVVSLYNLTNAAIANANNASEAHMVSDVDLVEGT